jgi:hypothetical protein
VADCHQDGWDKPDRPPEAILQASLIHCVGPEAPQWARDTGFVLKGGQFFETRRIQQTPLGEPSQRSRS